MRTVLNLAASVLIALVVFAAMVAGLVALVGRP